MAGTRRRKKEEGMEQVAEEPKKRGRKTPLEEGKLPEPVREQTRAETFATLPKGWGRPDEVIEKVTAIRTIFPGFNRGVRVGGLPTKRTHTIHGPSAHGKTAAAIGFAKSFTMRGAKGAAAYVDAEQSLDPRFVETLMDGPLTEMSNFFVRRPESYEETVDITDDFLLWAADRYREDPEFACVLIVDSINKLVPKREIKQLMASSNEGDARNKKKKGGDALDAGWGRYRAALNQAWIDHLTPLLVKANCALLLIAQEREDQEASFGDFDAFKVKGGSCLEYEASLMIRVQKSEPIRESTESSSPIVGWRHRMRIWKSKVGEMEGRHTDTYFCMQNASGGRGGFDTARDAIEVGKELGVVEGSSWLTWRGEKLGQGERRAIERLWASPDLLHAVLSDVNAAIDSEAGRTPSAA